MAVVIGWLIPLLPLLWSLLTKVFPKLCFYPPLIGVAGSCWGYRHYLCYPWLKIYQFLIGIPVWIGGLFKGVGPYRGYICCLSVLFCPCLCVFPVIMGFTLLISQYYENILEKIFLTVGANVYKGCL